MQTEPPPHRHHPLRSSVRDMAALLAQTSSIHQCLDANGDELYGMMGRLDNHCESTDDAAVEQEDLEIQEEVSAFLRRRTWRGFKLTHMVVGEEDELGQQSGNKAKKTRPSAMDDDDDGSDEDVLFCTVGTSGESPTNRSRLLKNVQFTTRRTSSSVPREGGDDEGNKGDTSARSRRPRSATLRYGVSSSSRAGNSGATTSAQQPFSFTPRSSMNATTSTCSDPTADLPATPRGSSSFPFFTSTPRPSASPQKKKESPPKQEDDGSHNGNDAAAERKKRTPFRGRGFYMGMQTIHLAWSSLYRLQQLAAVQTSVLPLPIPTKCLPTTASQTIVALQVVAQQCLQEASRIESHRRRCMACPVMAATRGGLSTPRGDTDTVWDAPAPQVPLAAEVDAVYTDLLHQVSSLPQGLVDLSQNKRQQAAAAAACGDLPIRYFSEDDDAQRTNDSSGDDATVSVDKRLAQLLNIALSIASVLMEVYTESHGSATGALIVAYVELLFRSDAQACLEVLTAVDKRAEAHRQWLAKTGGVPSTLLDSLPSPWQFCGGDRFCLEALSLMKLGRYTASAQKASEAVTFAEHQSNQPTGWICSRGKRTTVLAYLLRSEALRADGAAADLWLADAKAAAKENETAKRYSGVVCSSCSNVPPEVNKVCALPPMIHKLLTEFCGGIFIAARSEGEHASYLERCGSSSATSSSTSTPSSSSLPLGTKPSSPPLPMDFQQLTCVVKHHLAPPHHARNIASNNSSTSSTKYDAVPISAAAFNANKCLLWHALYHSMVHQCRQLLNLKVMTTAPIRTPGGGHDSLGLSNSAFMLLGDVRRAPLCLLVDTRLSALQNSCRLCHVASHNTTDANSGAKNNKKKEHGTGVKNTSSNRQRSTTPRARQESPRGNMHRTNTAPTSGLKRETAAAATTGTSASPAATATPAAAKKVSSFTKGKLSEMRRASVEHAAPHPVDAPSSSSSTPRRTASSRPQTAGSASPRSARKQSDTNANIADQGSTPAKQRPRSAYVIKKPRSSLKPTAGVKAPSYVSKFSRSSSVDKGNVDPHLLKLQPLHASCAAAAIALVACTVLYTRPRRLEEEQERSKKAQAKQWMASKADRDQQVQHAAATASGRSVNHIELSSMAVLSKTGVRYRPRPQSAQSPRTRTSWDTSVQKETATTATAPASSSTPSSGTAKAPPVANQGKRSRPSSAPSARRRTSTTSSTKPLHHRATTGGASAHVPVVNGLGGAGRTSSLKSPSTKSGNGSGGSAPQTADDHHPPRPHSAASIPRPPSAGGSRSQTPSMPSAAQQGRPPRPGSAPTARPTTNNNNTAAVPSIPKLNIPTAASASPCSSIEQLAAAAAAATKMAPQKEVGEEDDYDDAMLIYSDDDDDDDGVDAAIANIVAKAKHATQQHFAYVGNRSVSSNGTMAGGSGSDGPLKGRRIPAPPKQQFGTTSSTPQYSSGVGLDSNPYRDGWSV